MPYVLKCLTCGEESTLADCLIPGMCPQCGVAIIPLYREDNTIVCDKFRFIPVIRKRVKEIMQSIRSCPELLANPKLGHKIEKRNV